MYTWSKCNSLQEEQCAADERGAIKAPTGLTTQGLRQRATQLEAKQQQLEVKKIQEQKQKKQRQIELEEKREAKRKHEEEKALEVCVESLTESKRCGNKRPRKRMMSIGKVKVFRRVCV